MNQLKLKNISLALTEEDSNVRVKSSGQNVLLTSQNIENVIQIIGENFKIVDSFYLKRIGDNLQTIFELDDVHNFSVSIVLNYLYMYNLWRLKYKAKKYQDLRFKEADFSHPYTHDIIFSYFTTKYPDDWEIKCSVLMAMELNDLKKYYERRLQYYNK
jgi:hypothetical protein